MYQNKKCHFHNPPWQPKKALLRPMLSPSNPLQVPERNVKIWKYHEFSKALSK